MSSLNEVNLIGRLGQDPEVRYMQSGDAVCNLSLATSERWKDKSGEQKEATEWHKLVCYGRLAEVCGEYLKKGSLIYVKGSLKTRKWTDQQGQDRYTTEINFKEMKILSSREQGTGGAQSGAQPGAQSGTRPAQSGAAAPRQQPTPAPQATAQPPMNFDDDIPF